MVNAAATVSDDGVRIALGCVGGDPGARDGDGGETDRGDLSEDAVRGAAEGLGASLDPPGDVHGSPLTTDGILAEVAAVRRLLEAASRRKGA